MVGRIKDRLKFAIKSHGFKLEDVKVGDVIEFVYPKNHSIRTQRIHKIKGNIIIMKDVVGEFTKIEAKHIRRIYNE